jgi:hypothetical protein
MGWDAFLKDYDLLRLGGAGDKIIKIQNVDLEMNTHLPHYR